MHYLLPLLLGFTAASVGVAPPGLLNMTAAKVSAVDGRNRALMFALGASVTVFFQTYIAVLFAKFIDRNPDIVILLEEIGVFIFLGLTIYFFLAGKKKKKKEEVFQEKSKTNRFFLGMLLAFLNLLPIPYHVVISIWCSRKGWFIFNQADISLFVLGSVSGSFLMFYLYILFFKRKETDEPSFLMTNGNYIIGTVTGIISLFTIFKIITS
ncbi:MAG TPA: LysE family transporter [Flavobacterium sp.]|uniref:LysE family transporter n=1 Tax=Flavobacterium sp. TaxID=239 RepID=UPI002C3AB4D6|nr:LysE family transporter [Flavobacterium sp.]HSD14702.1 LysE family transporter [Flavobacterium sp.]